MKLFDYLEYLTYNEKIKASHEGQSNLQNALNKPSNIKIDEKFMKDKKNWENKKRVLMLDEVIKKNNKIDMNSRIVMLYNGNYYSGDASKLIHLYLVDDAYYNYDISHNTPIKKVEDWWADINKFIKEFVCLHADIKRNKKKNQNICYFSESYSNSDLLKNINDNDFNHYKKLVKDKLGLELVKELYNE